MDFNEFSTPYDEQDFQNEQDAAERAGRNWQTIDMQDPQFVEMRKQAALAYQWPATCDGTGVLEENRIAVDMTEVIWCKGCQACDEARMEDERKREREEAEAEKRKPRSSSRELLFRYRSGS